jgi:hypothetical protein
MSVYLSVSKPIVLNEPIEFSCATRCKVAASSPASNKHRCFADNSHDSDPRKTRKSRNGWCTNAGTNVGTSPTRSEAGHQKAISRNRKRRGVIAYTDGARIPAQKSAHREPSQEAGAAQSLVTRNRMSPFTGEVSDYCTQWMGVSDYALGTEQLCYSRTRKSA